MFYQLITNKRDKWLASDECPVKELVTYIIKKNEMRDAQTEAIKTFLYLKIACNNKPLWELFANGTFNSLNLAEEALTTKTREVLTTNPAAAALYEYSKLTNNKGQQVSPQIEEAIKQHPAELDYIKIIKDFFYDVTYADYLFSLPMGAGKTFLMAAFIYLNLYFASNEPDNKIFAHNFIVLAPSGLKTSIIPSLKQIRKFNPSWVIPEPAASKLKQSLIFEVLEDDKAAKKSNKTKNPNVQKINNHQPLGDLIGFVAVTNAEKVILDRVNITESNESELFSDDEETKSANELREIIGKIPNLSIFIDEVHHVADREIKLRQVVSKWAASTTFNSVLGFSGTPYNDDADKVAISDDLLVKNTQLSNVVYYYPLINGIGNFLKTPDVKSSNTDSGSIIRSGVRDFLSLYSNTTYGDGTCAKLAIYCGHIDNLETIVYPIVAEEVSSAGLDPSASILKFHDGNKLYPKPAGSDLDFASLDSSISKKKIILLVQIGKEGWDCKSLTGVILSQEGVCPTNMVLQTSCRCLRQVDKGRVETALIWLNESNANKLNQQLQKEQDITIADFSGKKATSLKAIEQYSRMNILNVPPIDYYQLRIKFNEVLLSAPDTNAILSSEDIYVKAKKAIIHKQDFEGKIIATTTEDKGLGEPLSFYQWLCLISDESFGSLTLATLLEYSDVLSKIYSKIFKLSDGVSREDLKYNQSKIRSLIRKSFITRRDLNVVEEKVPANAKLLKIENLSSPVYKDDLSKVFPDQESVRQIHDLDTGKVTDKVDSDMLKAFELLKAKGIDISAKYNLHPERLQTYHYIPYSFDSPFELEYLRSALTIIKEKQLEVYFNGDNSLTEFKIDCFKKDASSWRYIGKYTPDFVIISRNKYKKIHKILIVETKGAIYKDAFVDKRKFVSSEFIKFNNSAFGYNKFQFLYIEDSYSREKQEELTIDAINNFFNE